MIDITVDGHVHTYLCHHAVGTLEDYVQAAIKKGLAGIIFLEHLEAGINYPESTWLTAEDFDAYFHTGRELRKKYQGIVKIGLGVEVGYNPDCVAEITAELSRYQWDRIGISYHYMKADGRHFNMVSRRQSNIDALDRLGVDNVVSSYLKTLRQAVELLPGHVLCHFDAVLRHHPRIRFTTEHLALIGELLDVVAKKNMAIEINTSGYDIRNEPYPALPFLKEAARRAITLLPGSDAHRPADVGRYFERLPALVKNLS